MICRSGYAVITSISVIGVNSQSWTARSCHNQDQVEQQVGIIEWVPESTHMTGTSGWHTQAITQLDLYSSLESVPDSQHISNHQFQAVNPLPQEWSKPSRMILCQDLSQSDLHVLDALQDIPRQLKQLQGTSKRASHHVCFMFLSQTKTA